MSLKDWIVGTPKVVDNIFDKDKGLLTQVGQWIGHQSLSKEEEILHNAAMVKSIQAYSVATMGENTDRSKTRRTIATGWFQLQIQLIRLTVFCVFFDYLLSKLINENPHFTEKVLEIAFSPLLWSVTSGVGVFFWGSHALRSSKFAKDDKDDK